MPTFAEMKAKLSRRLLDPLNTAISDADVGDAVNSAVSYWKKQRVHTAKETATFTLAIGDSYIDNFPTDYLVPQDDEPFYITYGELRWDIDKVSNAAFNFQFTSNGSGQPYIITETGGIWQIYFIPDQAYSMTVNYYRDFVPLVADSDTNVFLEDAPDLILYEAMSRLFSEFRQDDKMEAYYSNRAENEAAVLNRMSNDISGTGSLEVEA